MASQRTAHRAPRLFSKLSALLLAAVFLLMTGAPSGRAHAAPPQETLATAHESPALGWRLIQVAAPGDANRIAVVFPDLREPYRTVFSTILAGIEESTGSPVLHFAVREKLDAGALDRELRQRNIRVVIALGRQGLRITSLLSRDLRIVLGGVIWAPQSDAHAASIVSLAPDPALLFSRLKALSPGIERVHVVYDPQQNDWLIRLARQAAGKQGIELQAVKADSLKSAVQSYQRILADIDPQRDALWLPQDSTTVDDTAVLPLILEQAWKRSLTVFSSSVVHVPRGALFSLYPDNLGLGRSLGRIAAAQLKEGSPPSGNVMPLQAVLTAVNLRTASHLGINLSYREQQAIDLVFPRP